jgi:epoxyqueuosine reductase
MINLNLKNSKESVSILVRKHPHDLLKSARTVVAFFIPFKPELIRENREGDRPCRNWGVAYVETNDLI